ncbi:hypothetical protein G7054_g4912 [Neopestalotiopsis clavispora]|nr:hypothetical protein G7054_g4912 [Neopestalotiopsis clavispora]
MNCRWHRLGTALLSYLHVSVIVAASTPSSSISRDVVIIGGGASGSHAAVWLCDQGKTVAVVEKREVLGGHTAVYNDPDTGKPINVGVQGWIQYGDTMGFVERMGVSTNGSMQFTTLTSEFVDFKTGLPVSGYSPPADDDKYAALQRILDVWEPYENLVLPGFFNFPNVSSIPEDLLMPFSQFVEKYNVSAGVPAIWEATAMGLSNTMEVPTLYVMQGSGVPMVRALLGLGASVVPPSGSLHELYDAIAAFLGEDVLYSSTVIEAARNETGVSVLVTNANGTVTEINAKRLLIAIEPTNDNMAPFDLDETEMDVLNKFGYATVYAGILQHPSLQINTSYSNTLPAAAPDNWTVYPTAPQVGRIDYLGGTTDLFQFTAVGTEEDTSESIRQVINDTINAMIDAGTLPKSNGTLTFPAFANHGMMHSRVSAEELLAGFIQKQYALQGRRSTYYTGAAFSAGFSTVLWAFNEQLLPMVIEGI